MTTKQILTTLLPCDSTWDNNEANPLALGCRSCPDFQLCGGLHTSDGAFDCDMRCKCSDQSKCDQVCRRHPERYVAYRREVSGFSLSNVPRAPILSYQDLPLVLPVIDHGSCRETILQEGHIAVPLHRLYHKKTGTIRFQNKSELCDHFKIRSDAVIVASGVGRDHLIEPFWRLNSADFLERLAALDIALFTVPNFSLFTNVPRQDNLHAMKRIALAWAAMTTAGLPTALHVNARTENDYVRWLAFVRERPEVKALAFEFGTGAGSESRIDFHVDRLCALAEASGRSVDLVLRGGVRRLPTLRNHFARVFVLDSTPFSKTRQRQRAVIDCQDRLDWERAFSTFGNGKPVDALLDHNIELSRRFIVNPSPPRNRLLNRGRRNPRKLAKHADGEPRQSSFGAKLQSPSIDKPFAA
jgi:hypothetical protein